MSLRAQESNLSRSCLYCTCKCKEQLFFTLTLTWFRLRHCLLQSVVNYSLRTQAIPKNLFK